MDDADLQTRSPAEEVSAEVSAEAGVNPRGQGGGSMATAVCIRGSRPENKVAQANSGPPALSGTIARCEKLCPISAMHREGFWASAL